MGVRNLRLRVQQSQGFLHNTAAVLNLVSILSQPLLQLHDPALTILVESKAVAQHLLHTVHSQGKSGDKLIVRRAMLLTFLPNVHIVKLFGQVVLRESNQGKCYLQRYSIQSDTLQLSDLRGYLSCLLNQFLAAFPENSR